MSSSLLRRLAAPKQTASAPLPYFDRTPTAGQDLPTALHRQTVRRAIGELCPRKMSGRGAGGRGPAPKVSALDGEAPESTGESRSRHCCSICMVGCRTNRALSLTVCLPVSFCRFCKLLLHVRKLGGVRSSPGLPLLPLPPLLPAHSSNSFLSSCVESVAQLLPCKAGDVHYLLNMIAACSLSSLCMLPCAFVVPGECWHALAPAGMRTCTTRRTC